MTHKENFAHAETVPESVPEAVQEPADSEAETADVLEATDPASLEARDRARGYRIGQWKGLPNFEAIDGSMSTLDERQIREHVRRRGLTRE